MAPSCGTTFGAALAVVEPSPSCPESLRPQQYTTPESLTAQVCSNPMDTCLGSLMPSTFTALVLTAPGSTPGFAPQHQRLLSARMAQLLLGPTVMDTGDVPAPPAAPALPELPPLPALPQSTQSTFSRSLTPESALQPKARTPRKTVRTAGCPMLRF